MARAGNTANVAALHFASATSTRCGASTVVFGALGDVGLHPSGSSSDVTHMPLPTNGLFTAMPRSFTAW